MPDPRPSTVRDEDFLEYLRHQPCAACLAAPPSEPHHLKQGRVGGKASDWTALPLCHECHRVYHDRGKRALEQRERVELWKEAHKHLRRYLRL